MDRNGPDFVPPEELVRILNTNPPKDLLILDLRVFAHYSKSRLQGALNLCIPTTLLKRPSYGVKRLAETFASRKDDKEKFESWRNVRAIIVYDAASWTLTQAASCVQVVQKFVNEQWQGATFILKGGLNAFAEKYADILDQRSVDEMYKTGSAKKLSIDPAATDSLAGGCMMPTDNSIKPFFHTIRQNIDLIGGVGQFPLRRPDALSKWQMMNMPAWLQRASDPKDEGKMVADRFLAIEKAEQQRMQEALSSQSWQAQKSSSPDNIRMAGIEKGVKNRYKDILPFEHTRVKLQAKNDENCDYVNASHVRPKHTPTNYIACQAPVPASVPDFWRVVWEQGARVIVMLTAESEEGHLKAHPYWATGTYGHFKVSLTRQEEQVLHYGPDSKPHRTFSSPVDKPFSKTQPVLSRRHTSNSSATHINAQRHADTDLSPDAAHVTVRRLQICDTADPSAPSRPISQVQLASWPDTGATARPKDILALVELCDSLDRPQQFSHPNSEKAHRPLIVHCSAGCGRTGTFCTVANVKSMLGKQLADRQSPRHSFGVGRKGVEEKRADSGGTMDLDDQAWMQDEEIDLIAMTVGEFRLHRMSMVQTLRQFVLCYEAVMELFLHDDWLRGGIGFDEDEEDEEDELGERDKMEFEIEKHAKMTSMTPAMKRPGMGKRARSGV